MLGRTGPVAALSLQGLRKHLVADPSFDTTFSAVVYAVTEPVDHPLNAAGADIATINEALYGGADEEAAAVLSAPLVASADSTAKPVRWPQGCPPKLAPQSS